MPSDIRNKLVEGAEEVSLYYSLFQNAKLKMNTRIPLIDNLLYKGTMRLSGGTFFFNPDPIKKHTRNPIVYKSKHVTVRLTKDGELKGTMRIRANEAADTKKARKLIIEIFQFLSLMNEQKDNMNL